MRSMNSSRLGRPVRLSCTASNSSRSSAFLKSVTSVSVPTRRTTSPSEPTTGRAFSAERQIMAVGGAQAEILVEAAAPLLDRAVERGAEAVAVERMQHVEPGRRRAFQRAALEAEQLFGFRAGVDLVGGDVPVPDQVAGAGQRERAAFDVGDDAVRDAAGEGVLHHREADQHHDQHQAAEQRRADDVVGDHAGDGKARRRRSTPPARARSGSAAPRGRSRGWRDRSPAPARTPRCRRATCARCRRRRRDRTPRPRSARRARRARRW